MKRDRVTREMARYIFDRDRGCVAVQLGAPSTECNGRLTIDHVRDHAAMGGKRAPSDRKHLVAVCENHHLWTGWVTSHKPQLREYLSGIES